MTARCGGGTSSSKAGVPGVVAVGAAGITEILAAAGLAVAGIGALIDGFVVDVASNCPRDPPPMPTWDVTDAPSFALGTISPTWPQTQQKINDFLYNWAWGIYCQCDEPGADNPPPPPPPVPGVSTQAAPVPQPCASATWTGEPIQWGGTPDIANMLDVGLQILPWVDPTPVNIVSLPYTFPSYLVKDNLSSVQFSRKLAQAVQIDQNVGPGVRFYCFDADSQLVDQFDIGGYSSIPPWTLEHPLVPGIKWICASAYYDTDHLSGGMVEPTTTSLNIRWYCGPTSTTGTDCCPPDPNVTLALNNVLHIVQNIQQRLAALDQGYEDGTRHSDLTGTGSVYLDASTLAVRIEIHPPNPPVVILPGTPSYYFDVGFVTPYEHMAAFRSTRVTFTTQVVPLPPTTDQLGYTLLNGVSIDLVELHAATAAASP